MATAQVIYQERAYLRRNGHQALDEAFRECARLYNAALEHWQTCGGAQGQAGEVRGRDGGRDAEGQGRWTDRGGRNRCGRRSRS